MEEDIKNIEEMLEFKEDIIKYHAWVGTKLINSVENLLKRYKELKEENKELKKQLEEKDMQHELELIGKEEYTKANMGEIIEHYYTANEDCIPISVIQNKIDELTKYRDLAKEQIERRIVIADSDSLNFGRAEAHDKDIQVLQELLEERKENNG